MLLRVMRRPDYSDSSDQEIEPTNNQKQIPSVGLKEWLHSVSHGQTQNNKYTKKLVLNFLISQGYFDIAKTFSQQANIPMDEWANQEEIKNRYEIKNMIKKGEIKEALQSIEKIDPEFCSKEENQWAVFMLKCLKVINLIKNQEFDSAINIGKHQLLPFSQKGQKYLTQIQRVMSLIAFINVKNCPNAELASYQHSSNIANLINKNMLASKSSQQNLQISQSLQMVLKMGKWCEKQLSHYLKFPIFKLQSTQELFIEPQ